MDFNIPGKMYFFHWYVDMLLPDSCAHFSEEEEEKAINYSVEHGDESGLIVTSDWVSALQMLVQTSLSFYNDDFTDYHRGEKMGKKMGQVRDGNTIIITFAKPEYMLRWLLLLNRFKFLCLRKARQRLQTRTQTLSHFIIPDVMSVVYQYTNNQ